MTSYFVCNSVFRLLGPAIPLGTNSASVSIQVGEVQAVLADASTATATTATSTTATSTAADTNGHAVPSASSVPETVEVPVFHRVIPEAVEVSFNASACHDYALYF
jgi:uncharacterized protein YqgV (UPF0045/DUF77 family)